MRLSPSAYVLIAVAFMCALSGITAAQLSSGYGSHFCLISPNQGLTGLAQCAENTPGLVFRLLLVGRMPGVLLPTAPIANGLSISRPTASQLVNYLYGVGLVPSDRLLQEASINGTANTFLVNNGTIVQNNTTITHLSTLALNFTFNGDFYSRANSPYPGGIPCPVINTNNLPRRFWGLCGGDYDAGVDYWGQQAVCFGVCSFPRFNPYCLKQGVQTFTYGGDGRNCNKMLPGCFDGYDNQTHCISSTGASFCATVHTSASSPGSNFPVYHGDKWCPVGPSDTDPVLCKRQGVVSRECIRNFVEGLPVNGDRNFCLQNQCAPASTCMCEYNILTENRKVAGAPLAIFQSYVVKRTTRFAPIVHYSVSSPVVHHVWADSCVTIHIVPTNQIITTIVKKNDQVTIEEHGSNHVICQTEAMRKQSGYITATSTFYGEVVQTSSHYAPGVIKCDKFIDDWEDLLNTDCMTDGQIFGIVAISITLGIMTLLLTIALLILLITCAMWARTKYMLRQANESGEQMRGRSMLLSDIMRAMQSAGRYIYSPAVLSLMLVTGCAASCGRISKVTGESYICDPDCQLYTENLIYFRNVGDSFCVNVSPMEMYSISLLSVKGLLSTREIYYTTEWETRTETHVRCNHAGGCDPSSCIGRLADRTAGNNLYDPHVTTNPGMTYCSQVCKGEGIIKDGIDCGCVDVTPNCNYHGFGIVPNGNWALVRELGQIALTPVFQITYSNGTKKTVQGDYDDDRFKLRVVTDLTIQHNLGPGVGTISGSLAPSFTQISPAGSPRKTTVGDIQAVNFESFSNTGLNSFLFDEDILSGVVCEGQNCNWVFSKPGLTLAKDEGHSCSFPCRKAGYTYTNDTSSTASVLNIGVSFNGSPVVIGVSFTYAGVNQTSSVDNVCPKVETEDPFTGCVGCDIAMVGSIRASSSCDSGMAKVSIEGCMEPIPSYIHLTTEEAVYTVSCFMGSSPNRVEVCLEGAYRSCDQLQTVVVASEILLPNSTNYDIKEDGHHDENQWNPFAVFKNIINGVGDWLDWLLMGLFVTISVVVVVGLIWLSWPLLVSLIKWVRDREWRYKKVESVEEPMVDVVPGIKKVTIAEGLDQTEGENPIVVWT